MRRMMVAGAVALLSLGVAGTAFAQSEVVLASGNDIITWDGSTLACSTNGGATVDNNCTSVTETGWGVSTVGTNSSNGTYDLTATDFNGWKITGNTAQTQTPDCTAAGCMDQTQINVLGGSSNLTAYFGSSGFASQQAVVDTQAVSNATQSFSSQGYYNSSSSALASLGYSAGNAPNLSSWNTIGGLMTLNACSGLTCGTEGQATSSALPPGPFALTTAMTLSAGGDYNVTDTITAVPEPASAVLFGGVLLAIATGLRRKLVSKA